MRYLICLLLLTSNIYANDYDFRKTRWNMVIEQVKVSEAITLDKKWELVEDKKGVGTNTWVLSYVDSMMGNKCRLNYLFHEDRLESSGYSFFLPKDADLLYKNLGEMLISKHGEPVIIGKTLTWPTSDDRTLILLDFKESINKDGIGTIYSINVTYIARLYKELSHYYEDIKRRQF